MVIDVILSHDDTKSMGYTVLQHPYLYLNH